MRGVCGLAGEVVPQANDQRGIHRQGNPLPGIHARSGAQATLDSPDD